VELLEQEHLQLHQMSIIELNIHPKNLDVLQYMRLQQHNHLLILLVEILEFLLKIEFMIEYSD
jgi:hypothetical protein